MLYSHSIENDKIGIFASFVRSTIEGQRDYKSIVDRVINEAHQLALGEKNFYNIDRDNFSVIVYLNKKNPDFFRNVDSRNSDTSTYDQVLNILSERRTIGVY